MPTGYTAEICKGEQSFEDFAMNCARAFGALVTMRDEQGKEIPEKFEASDYHSKAIEKIQTELDDLYAMRSEEAGVKAHEEYLKEKERLEGRIIKEIETAVRLELMKESAEAWNPPTDDHIQLREFMLEQLQTTMQHDGNPAYYRKELAKLSEESGSLWKAEKISKLISDIKYHKAEHEKEVKRTKERNDWLRKLRLSLSV